MFLNEDLNELIVSVFLPQTELLPHCSDVPPLARVVQEDGKLLIQAVLEVRSITFLHTHTCQTAHEFHHLSEVSSFL